MLYSSMLVCTYIAEKYTVPIFKMTIKQLFFQVAGIARVLHGQVDEAIGGEINGYEKCLFAQIKSYANLCGVITERK